MQALEYSDCAFPTRETMAHRCYLACRHDTIVQTKVTPRRQRCGRSKVNQNPKTIPKETRGILGRTVQAGRKDDAEESSHGRADRGGFVVGRRGRTMFNILAARRCPI